MMPVPEMPDDSPVLAAGSVDDVDAIFGCLANKQSVTVVPPGCSSLCVTATQFFSEPFF
jgi:hypothetical protein